MESFDMVEDLRLSFYAQYIGRRYPDIQMCSRSRGGFLLVDGVAPSDHECPVRYCPIQKRWYDSERDFCHLEIRPDGLVLVAYVDETDEDGSMDLQVLHPREALEFIDLLHRLIADFAERTVRMSSRPLSSVADIQIILPCGGKWRAWNPAIAMADMSREFASALLNCLRAGESPLHAKPENAAAAICDRWPEQVASMVDDELILREGYVLSASRGVTSAMELAIGHPAKNSHFAKLLLLPPKGKVSWLYLREYLAGDIDAGAAISSMFASLHSPEALNIAFRNIMLQMPDNVMDQVRMAAEINMTRQWLVGETDRALRRRTKIHALRDSYWATADALYRVANHNDKGVTP